MKKLSILFGALILVGIMAGCSQPADAGTSNSEEVPAPQGAGAKGDGSGAPTAVTASED